MSNQGMQKKWADRNATKAREMILRPNSGSEIDIERFVFALNQDLVLGTASTISATEKPDTVIRPERVTANVPRESFVFLTKLKLANLDVIVGGSVDTFDFNADGQDQHLNLPTLSPENPVTIGGSYTGAVPVGFTLGGTFKFALSLKGPASLVP